jgi:hypothetical protein
MDIFQRPVKLNLDFMYVSFSNYFDCTYNKKSMYTVLVHLCTVRELSHILSTAFLQPFMYCFRFYAMEIIKQGLLQCTKILGLHAHNEIIGKSELVSC